MQSAPAGPSAIQLIPLILTALAALAGTLTAGTIGLLFGLAQFRRERAFERRLEWHETAIKALLKASQTLRSVAMSMQIPQFKDLLEESMKAVKDIPVGEELELGAEMYARRATYNAIRQARADQRRIIISFVQLGNARKTSELKQHDEADIERVSAHMLELTAKSMMHAASMLAQDVRTFLRLDSLKRDSLLYDEKPQRSIRTEANEDLDAFLRRMHSNESL